MRGGSAPPGPVPAHTKAATGTYPWIEGKWVGERHGSEGRDVGKEVPEREKREGMLRVEEGKKERGRLHEN